MRTLSFCHSIFKRFTILYMIPGNVWSKKWLWLGNGCYLSIRDSFLKLCRRHFFINTPSFDTQPSSPKATTIRSPLIEGDGSGSVRPKSKAKRRQRARKVRKPLNKKWTISKFQTSPRKVSDKSQMAQEISKRHLWCKRQTGAEWRWWETGGGLEDAPRISASCAEWRSFEQKKK